MAKVKTQQQIEFDKTIQESKMLLKKIGIKLKSMKKEQTKHIGNWGYNGSVGSVKQSLQEIYDSLKSWL